LHGVKMTVEIDHADFLNKRESGGTDRIEIYAPLDLVRRFAADDITSQQLIDGCVVLVDGNRISVNLAIT
jgi:hypothetical protein